ncbi:ATP-binding cassette domain-containing protein [Paenibacillus thermoaerophilus]|uniref:ATP-binding cassette domain-containing protein n=1 Tax=Paenibacillus thermoaerophilus TaxID=1215385 RepID=A0ABW2V882_9BACL|nr:ATP-binding cassette domain-containing protein [Paenibacillus thermoaerophilus]
MNLNEDLVLEDVTVYPEADRTRTPILRGIGLRIGRGEWISVVGRNGSGKSTLIRTIAGVQPAHEGVVRRGFAGDEPIPYVMQRDHQWFGETPREELVFWLEMRGEPASRIRDKVDSALAAVGLAEAAERPLSQLSGGQRQLVAAAGCLAADAPLLIFDEATSMLDTAARRLVFGAVRAIHASGTTVLWLTHHQEEAACGDRIVALHHGSIAYDGPPALFYYGEAERFLGEFGDSGSGAAPCDALGFEPPFAVRVARELMRHGVRFGRLPLTAEQLADEVKAG